MAVVIPVSSTICGGMDATGVDQRGQLAEHVAAADLHRPDLGDGVAPAVSGQASRAFAAAGGLEVDDDEGGLPQSDSSASASVRVRAQLCSQLPHATLTVGRSD